MKVKNRIKLHLRRTLPNGIFEEFYVTVMKDVRQAAVEKYKAEGYSVNDGAYIL